MKKYFKIYTIVIGIMLSFCMGSFVNASEHHATGLEPMDEKDFEAFIESLPEVIEVKLNEDALARLKSSKEIRDKSKVNEIESVEVGEEIVTDKDDVPRTMRNESAIEEQAELINSIPSYDGSTSKHFPPIGDQGDSGSCTSWSLGYYQLSNNIANIRDLDAKNNVKYRISPRWIHNLSKNYESMNKGAGNYDVFPILKKQGAPYWDVCPGQTTINNFKSWNPDPDIWESALKNRVEDVSYCYVANDSTKQVDLSELKTILLNGYVVSFDAYYDGSLEDYIHNNKILSPLSKKDDWILTSLSAYAFKDIKKNRGHRITIVGWDDNIEIDSDEDGIMDSKGALKIANSWGNRYNEGFFWIAYEALKPQKKVDDGKAHKASAIYNNVIYFMMPKKTYTPLLLAELTIETNSRRQLGVELGISSKNSSSGSNYQHIYENTFRNASLIYRSPFYFKGCDKGSDPKDNYQPVNYDFYGNKSLQRTKATFLFDLTDTVLDFYNRTGSDIIANGDSRFYFRIEDNTKDGFSSALTSIKIIDRMTNTIRTKNVSCEVDGSIDEVYLDYAILPRIVNPDKIFTLTFNYPIQVGTLNESLEVKQDGLNKYPVQINSPNLGDRKTIYVSAPTEKYESGHPYVLDMGKLRSEGNNPLSGDTAFWFYVP